MIKKEDYEKIEEEIKKEIMDKKEIKKRYVIMEVEGKVEGEEIEIKNWEWVVSNKKMIDDMGFEEVKVINDLEEKEIEVV